MSRKRREFSRQVTVDRIKAATREGVVYCDKCGLPCTRFDIHHIIEAALGGEPTFENSALWCEPCHDEYTATISVPTIAKVKRIEAKHLGATRPKQTIKSRGFAPTGTKRKVHPVAMPERRPMFEDVK